MAAAGVSAPRAHDKPHSAAARASAANKLHVLHCFDAMMHHLHGQPNHPPVQHKWNGDKFPLFVTWKKQNGPGDWRLRGCIGTFSPKELAAGLREYAIIAAFQDSRFRPIDVSELAQLRCDISLLTHFEQVTPPGGNGLASLHNMFDWTIGQHGIQIDFACPDSHKRYSATFLPEVASEQGWSHEETLAELVHKSGYRGGFSPRLAARIQLTRYQSEKESLTWKQYCDLRHSVTGIPLLHAHMSLKHPRQADEDEEADADGDDADSDSAEQEEAEARAAEEDDDEAQAERASSHAKKAKYAAAAAAPRK